MKVRFLFIILIIFSLLFCSGCWDYTEYERLAMVSALGIDYDETAKQVTVTVEQMIAGNTTAQNGAGGGAKTSSQVIKASGVTVAEALSKIQQSNTKRLFYSYMSVLVVGKDAANFMMQDIVGLIDRTPDIRTSTYITMVNGKAEDVLATKDPNLVTPTGKIIFDMVGNSVYSGIAFPVTIQDFEDNLAIGGRNSIAPRVTAVNADVSNSISSQAGSSGSSTTNISSSSGGTSNQSGSNSGSSSNPGSSSSNGSSSAGGKEGSGSSADSMNQEPFKWMTQKTGYLKIDGIAVFNGDKLAGWLEGNECLGLGWILNKNISPYENVPIIKDGTKHTMIFKVSKSESKIKMQFVDGKPEITVNVSITTDMRKYGEGIDLEVLSPDTISVLEQKLSYNVKSEITAALTKGQKELKTDAFGFGFEFYRQYPELWHKSYEKEWKTIFPGLTINVNVTAKIINTGTNIEKFKEK